MPFGPGSLARHPGWFLPPLAIVLFGLGVVLVLASAGSTLGYDYRAYAAAGERLLDGKRLFDPNVNVAGGFAIFLYPPPFAVAMIPFALLPADAGLWLWIGLSVGAFLVGVAVMPVRPTVRWLVVLLAGTSWPFLYTLKLGQVTPFLFLLFVVGWRSLDRPPALGASIAAGTAIKVQPALELAWALVTKRWRAAGITLVAVLVLALIGTLVSGVGAWLDYVALLARVSAPVTTPHNFTPGAIAFQMGASEATATAIQWAWVGAIVLVTVISWLRADAETSYVITVIASQAVSPLLWDHYAMVLLIPVALLLERRQYWAAAIPLMTWLPGVWLYPVAFGLSAAGVALTERTQESTPVRIAPVVS